MKHLITLTLGIALSSVAFTQLGCSVEHKETDHPNLLGGSTHTDETKVTNPDGSTATDIKSTKSTD
jgi:hypothetical protein